MLGSQSWFVALAGPTLLIGGFVASRKRLAYQWREELMDPDGAAYPPLTDADMDYLRRVAPAAAVEEVEHHGRHGMPDDALGVRLRKEENIGLRVRSGVLSAAEQCLYLNEVRRWAASVGNAIDPRKVAVFKQRLADELAPAAGSSETDGGGSADTFLTRTWAALWGGVSGGTGVHEAQLLSTMGEDFYRDLRIISDHAEDIQLMRAPWGSGDRMRLEEMPASLRHLVQRTASAHAGMGRLRHVYMEYSPTGRFYREPRTPKAFDGHDYVIIPLRRDGGDCVVTFAPVLRSKFSLLTEVARSSWTSRDVDALVPAGASLRVTGGARYDWGWGLRPGPVWFGSRLNVANRAITADARGAGGGGAAVRDSALPTACPAEDAAMVVLHFEGPRAKGKKRSLLFQPEALIFGRTPSVESFDKWVDDRPTREDVQEEGVVRFIMKRYLEMLTVS